MGTDIHWVPQRQVDGKWHDLTFSETKFNEVTGKYEPTTGDFDFPDDRNYDLFAWLGNVRNGSGFAGFYRHEPLDALAAKRGLPDDFDVNGENEHNGVWMGDHSHSWVLFEQILSAEPPVFHHRDGPIYRSEHIEGFVAAAKRLADKYGAENLRLVFGFDS